jgi:hypothetical protein
LGRVRIDQDALIDAIQDLAHQYERGEVPVKTSVPVYDTTVDTAYHEALVGKLTKKIMGLEYAQQAQLEEETRRKEAETALSNAVKERLHFMQELAMIQRGNVVDCLTSAPMGQISLVA